MKPYPVLQALLLLGTTSVYGQINLSAMDSLSADSLQKSEIRYFSPGKGGVNRVWNFSQKLGSKVSSQVMFVKDSTGVISIIEPGRNRYYHSTAADFQPYKYNGKELDKMHGLNAYDYGARQYNPILARWDRIDPLAEKYYDVSLYAYCEDSPVNTFDPDGRNSIKVISKAVYKIGKSVAKNGVESLTKSATYTAAFHGVVKDTKTLLDSNASTWDRTVAGVNLLSEVIGPISFKDAKTIQGVSILTRYQILMERPRQNRYSNKPKIAHMINLIGKRVV